MGKGDKKSKRGKIIEGSYGVSRPRKIKKSMPPHAPAVETLQAEKEVKAPVTKRKTKTTVPH